MKRFLSLLFLSFLCTCVSAQKETSSPDVTTQASNGSGSLLVEFGDGNYDYNFTRGGDNGYYFAGVHFMSGEECGLVQYALNLLQTVDGQLTGFYQPEPCVSEAKPKPIYGRYPIRRTWLKGFVLGSQRIEVEEVRQTVFY